MHFRITADAAHSNPQEVGMQILLWAVPGGGAVVLGRLSWLIKEHRPPGSYVSTQYCDSTTVPGGESHQSSAAALHSLLVQYYYTLVSSSTGFKPLQDCRGCLSNLRISCLF
jgi:hypothetical protein